jgi:hypothetical protein
LPLAGILAFAIVLCRGGVFGLIGAAGNAVGSISPGSESASVEAGHGGGGNKQTGGTIHDITVFSCFWVETERWNQVAKRPEALLQKSSPRSGNKRSRSYAMRFEMGRTAVRFIPANLGNIG